MPGLSPNPAPRLKWVPGAGRGQAAGGETPKPVGQGGGLPRLPSEQTAQRPGSCTCEVPPRSFRGWEGSRCSLGSSLPTAFCLTVLLPCQQVTRLWPHFGSHQGGGLQDGSCLCLALTHGVWHPTGSSSTSFLHLLLPAPSSQQQQSRASMWGQGPDQQRLWAWRQFLLGPCEGGGGAIGCSCSCSCPHHLHPFTVSSTAAVAIPDRLWLPSEPSCDSTSV